MNSKIYCIFKFVEEMFTTNLPLVAVPFIEKPLVVPAQSWGTVPLFDLWLCDAISVSDVRYTEFIH